MKLFIVEALRHGDRENHSYIVGAYSNEEAANLAAKIEEAWRGGKYKCVVNNYATNQAPRKEKADFYFQSK